MEELLWILGLNKAAAPLWSCFAATGRAAIQLDARVLLFSFFHRVVSFLT